MNNEDKAFWLSWCIEEYAAAQHVKSHEVARLFSELHVLEFLDQNAEILHTQGKRYIIEEILEFIAKHHETSTSHSP